MAGLLIRLRFGVGDLEALDLSTSYLAKLPLPALAGLGYQEQDQAVPGLAELGHCGIRFSHERDDRKVLILKLDWLGRRGGRRTGF